MGDHSFTASNRRLTDTERRS